MCEVFGNVGKYTLSILPSGLEITMITQDLSLETMDKFTKLKHRHYLYQ